jgi:type I restriction enzyme S subunit
VIVKLKPGWKIVKFGDIVNNAKLTEKEPLTAGIKRVVGLEHLEPGDLHIHRWHSAEDGTSFSRKFVPGQTLFGKRRAYQRKVAYAKFKGICSGDILTFETKDPNVLMPELLPFICQTDAFFEYALGTSAGSLSPRTSWNALKDYEFTLPPLDQQRRIAEILWAADGVEFKYEKLIQEIIRTSKTILRERLSYYWKKGREGKIPVLKLSSLLTNPICNGVFKKMECFGEGTLLINVSDIYSAFRVLPNKLERVKVSTKEMVSFSAQSGDVIFNRSSLVLEGIGHACLVPEWEEPMVFECHLMRARPYQKMIHPSYLCRYSLSSFGRKYLMSRAQTTTMTTINQGDLNKMPIPVPPLHEQNDLVYILDICDAKQAELLTFKKNIIQIKKKIMNDVFEGETSYV